MCGRYALYGPSSRIREQFNLNGEFDFEPQCSFTLKVIAGQAATPYHETSKGALCSPAKVRGTRGGA